MATVLHSGSSGSLLRIKNVDLCCGSVQGLECLPLLDVFTPGLVAVLSVPASSVANPILALTARLRAFRLRPSQHYVVIGAGGVTYDMSTFAVSKV